MKFKKLIALMTLASMMTANMTSVGFAEESVKEALKQQMVDSVLTNVHAGAKQLSDDLTIYSNIGQASCADTLPDKLDLRDRGVVPEIQNQGGFGTCWGFASIAASEVSILSSLGMTAQEYLEHYGKEFKLSERHLAWFSSLPIQEAEGMSEDELAQIGEGRILFEDDGSASAHYDIGGFMGYASSMFAAGVGPVSAELVPYTANDGSSSMAEDWSVDDSLRFSTSFELKDSSILPTPADHDEDGNYIYNEIATEMIKQELIAGRAVSIAYHADQAKDPESELKLYVDYLYAQGIDERYIEAFLALQNGDSSMEELPEDVQLGCLKILIMGFTGESFADLSYETVEEASIAYMAAVQEAGLLPGTDSEIEEVSGAEEIAEDALVDDSGARAAAERLGVDYDEAMDIFKKQAETDKTVYINTDNYAQYCWDKDAPVSHAVTIVGYDDNFPASEFVEGHEPPADGAWIVRNSWGEDYGNDGYFYLSYYDQTIIAPETFEFVVDEEAQNRTAVVINEYDLMPIAAVSSGASKEPVYMANEFTMTSDAVLSYVSCMTANLNTNVTAAVYLLNENSQNPTDGELLDVCTVDFKYAGYHRIPLNQNYKLPQGSRISVVETQRYDDADGRYYAMPYGIGLNRSFYEDYNALIENVPDSQLSTFGIEGKISSGESFVSIDGTWMDWGDLVEEVKEESSLVNAYASFDNLPIKAYYYLLSDIDEQHAFGDPLPYADGDVRLCTDCGYSLVER